MGLLKWLSSLPYPVAGSTLELLPVPGRDLLFAGSLLLLVLNASVNALVNPVNLSSTVFDLLLFCLLESELLIADLELAKRLFILLLDAIFYYSVSFYLVLFLVGTPNNAANAFPRLLDFLDCFLVWTPIVVLPK